MLSDLRYAIRGLRRSPAWSLAVLLTFGLGIGANALMFGVIDRLMLRPFPFLERNKEIHRVYLQISFQGQTRTSSVIPYTRYLDLARDTRSFSQVAAISDCLLYTSDAADERSSVDLGG